MTEQSKHRLREHLPVCDLSNSILEGDLELAVLQQSISELKVMETPDGLFYVVAFLKWVEGKEWYLTTRRDRNAPKVFKSLERLNIHLRETYPTPSFTLIRNQPLPGAKPGAMATKSKVKRVRASGATKRRCSH